MAQAVIFHARPGNTFLHRLHPAMKFLLLLALSVTSVFLSLDALLVILLLLMLAALWVRLPLREMHGTLFSLSFLLLLIGITEYWSTGSIRLSCPPVLRFLAIFLGSLLLTDTTMPSDMARGIGSFLSPVLGKRAWKFASMVELTMAMLPLITDTVLGIHEARIARGERLLRHPIRSLVGLSSSIVSTLLDRVGDYADALSSREYDNSMPRPLGRGIHLEEAMAFLLLLFLLGATVWTRRH